MSADRALAILLDVSSRILDADDLEETDHFFRRGGNSMQLLRLVAAMEQRGMQVDLQQLLESPSFADLARHCTFLPDEAR